MIAITRFKFSSILAFFLSTVLIVSLIPSVSSAKEKTSNDNILFNQNIKSKFKQLDSVENQVNFLLNKATTKQGGKYILNEDVVEQKYPVSELPIIEDFVKLLNNQSLTSKDFSEIPSQYLNIKAQSTLAIGGSVSARGLGLAQTNVLPFNSLSASSYIKCLSRSVLEATGLTSLSKGVTALLKKKAWKEAAIQIAKAAAIIGLDDVDVAVLAVQMAYYSVKCAL